LKFIVKEKSGFSTFDKVVKISDNNGMLFYFKENRNGKLVFNLPKGIYNTDNNLFKSKFVKHKIYNLPSPNSIKKLPKKFKILYINNPHKCSVNNRTHTIYFDNSFRNVPKPIKMYILLHEVGHYFYSGQGQKSEIYCDLFSANEMLKIGFNPSQIKWAQSGTLSNSETSLERKDKVYNHLVKL
jgi:hypothetical protein